MKKAVLVISMLFVSVQAFAFGDYTSSGKWGHTYSNTSSNTSSDYYSGY